MESAIKYAKVLFVVFAIHSCGGGSIAICENQAEIFNDKDDTALGYFVAIEKSIDVATEATRFMEQYHDLEVFSVWPLINMFHANSGHATLEQIRCESSVEFIEYNSTITQAGQ